MMKTLTQLFSNEWAEAVGWSLLHSVWLALVILLTVLACLRFIPPVFSRIRYAIASAGLFVFIASAILTFLFLLNRPEPVVAVTHPASMDSSAPGFVYQVTRKPVLEVALFAVSSAVDSNMPLILTAWIIGFFIYVLRLVSGVYYTHKLVSAALPLQNEWSDYIKRVSKELSISRLIILAESAKISTPMVIGYFKPVILVPIGMLSGLTTQQIEMIFVHELAHIRRHDYLINVIQSLVETVFFFNPFTWIISGIIRREREYCCDDLVIAQHSGARSYAYALAKLAEVRLSHPAFALPLGEGRNQLLNRIKRIMEKSVNDSGKGRIVIPAVLLVAGMFCVSWLGIAPSAGYKKDPALTDQDTLKNKKEKAARYSRRSIITIDENGQPHEEVVEEFEGDEELRPLMESPSIPDISALPDVPNFPVDPPLPDVDIQALPDTIPPPLPFHNEKEWDEFTRSFSESFRRTFRDLQGIKDSEVWEELKQFEERFESGDWPEPFDSHFGPNAFDKLKAFPDSATLKNFERQFEHLQKEFEKRDFERMGERGMERLHELEKALQHREGNLRNFEKAIQEQLIEDGYLSENEVIESLEWSNDSFKVNGTKVKEADRNKYK
ncbi:MAG TPA: M56 family metallopeptidase [Chryseosolibacter sp.]|nr:M56 family metallopeptidase [Chryseosolibacter sp.]